MAKKFRKSDIKKAIEGSGGYISEIAKRLNCDWGTAKKYIKQFDLQTDLEREDETATDLAEKALMDRIKKGDTAAIIFRLKTKGKERGYVERTNVEHTGRINSEHRIEIEFIPAPVATDDILSIDDQQHLRRLEENAR